MISHKSVTGAVDVGGTKIATGLVTGRQVLARREIPTRSALQYEHAVAQIAGLLREMVRETGARLDGIGIGLTGRVHPLTRRIGRNDLLNDWQDRDLTGDLGAALQVSARIENDADAAALAEAALGAGRGKERFIYVTVSTGIGGGMVLHGKLYRGVLGSHPEIGHHVIEPDGPACFCGARGCWESLASGTAMLKWALANFAEARALTNLDARQICDLAEAGSGWAQDAVRREGYYLGIGLSNLITMFAPDQIGLGGGMMRRWGLFEPYAREAIGQGCALVPVEHVAISLAELGDDTPLIGAAQVWLQQD